MRSYRDFCKFFACGEGTLNVPAAIWAIVGLSMGCVLTRPRGLPEWVAASAGAVALIAFGLLAPGQALAAVARGLDVYLFLIGMMVLAEIARGAGLFDWIATHAVRAAAGSGTRLFTLVYAACVVVTIVLSNDATAVVLTPAVAAAVRRARARPLPYLYACAFVANAASFVLPISNPANLVVFGRALPPLVDWLRLFGLPSVVAIGVTYATLRLYARKGLRGRIALDVAPQHLARNGRIALAGIGGTALALVIASGRGAALGVTTAVAASVVGAWVTVVDRRAMRDALRGVSWTVVPLVAALFVLVAGADRTGALDAGRRAVTALGSDAGWHAVFGAGIATALISNVTNNLPSGLFAGFVLQSAPHARAISSAIAIGVDLGPNLSVTGSLATVLWLVALRREGISVGTLAFLRVGAVVMPPALLLALAALAAAAR
ncbi:MAG: arsenic transporter [Vulcanimicrobiaceae bacterium]